MKQDNTDRMFDKRVVRRNIASGRITTEDYDRYVAALADASTKILPPDEGGDRDGYESEPAASVPSEGAGPELAPPEADGSAVRDTYPGATSADPTPNESPVTPAAPASEQTVPFTEAPAPHDVPSAPAAAHPASGAPTPQATPAIVEPEPGPAAQLHVDSVPASPQLVDPAPAAPQLAVQVSAATDAQVSAATDTHEAESAPATDPSGEQPEEQPSAAPAVEPATSLEDGETPTS